MAARTLPQPDSPRTVTVHVLTRYEARRVRARAHVLGEVFDTQGGRVELYLYSTRSRQVHARRTIRRLGREEVTFDTRRVPFGCCAFEASFIDRHGSRWRTQVIQDSLPGAFPWLGSSEGVSRRVPPPWIPLEVSQHNRVTTVSCWGREYTFAGKNLVSTVAAADADLLAAPITVRAIVSGRQVRWQRAEVDVVAQSRDRVLLTSRAVAARGLSLTARIQIDFDGMIRLDWELSTRRALQLDALSVDVPMRPEVARYVYHFPGSWGQSRNVGALPSDGIRLGFRPFVWLGDEERGFSWFAESDQGFSLRDPEGAIEVIPGSNVTLMRVNLVTLPARLLPGSGEESASTFTGHGEETQPVVPGGLVTERLQYAMGLQATPVKPVESDAWEQRIYCINQSTEGFRPRLRVSNALLDRLVAAGVRAVVLFEHWADAEGYVRTPHDRAVRKIVDACHQRGLKVLLYHSFLISDLIDEWQAIGKDCLVVPKGGYPVFHYQPQPDQSAWRVCLNSLYQDLLVHGMAEAMDRYDTDGVYLDGTEYPFACANTEHGCGSLQPGGAIAPTYPLFAVRSAMRRIHEVVRSRRRHGLINVHNSTCMTIPTLGWATSYWDGEQFQGVGAGTDVAALLPLDAFRAEFMGRQWGVPAEFLLAGAAYTYEQAWSFSLLHDVPVRPIAARDLELISRIWRTMDDFGRQQAEWLPYWRNADEVSVSPHDCYVSLYRHPRHGVLAVVANLSTRETTVRWTLDLAALGLDAENLHAVDALDGGPVTLKSGAGAVRLPPLGWKLLWIRS